MLKGLITLFGASQQATKNDTTVVLIVTVAMSVILSLSQILSDSVINSDGIMYLQAASYIQTGNWGSASNVYNWLFYPYLVANFSSLSALSLEQSAHTLNTIFSAITCVIFILIARKVGGKNRAILYLSSLIILCYPNLNEYRNMIARDHGYWAFYLLTCYFFIQTYQFVSFRNIILLITFACIATLFRVEGLLFLLALPLFLLYKHKSSIKKPALVVIFIFTCAALLLVFDSIPNLHGFSKAKQFETLAEAPSSKMPSAITITEGYLNKLSPKGHSTDYAPAVLSFIFLIILITEILSAISPFYVILAILIIHMMIRNESLKKFHFTKPIFYIIAINVFILCGFIFSNFFIAGRYPIPLALSILLVLPFLLHTFFQHLKREQIVKFNKTFNAVFILFLIISLDGMISLGASKTYLKEAGEWVSKHRLQTEQTFYTNNQFVNFYAHNQSGDRLIEHNLNIVLKKLKSKQLADKKLLAIQISRKNLDGKKALLKTLNIEPIKVFTNDKGDSVLVFKQESF